KLSASYTEKLIVQGSDPLENPSGIITMFGYLNDFPPQPVERTKTEADQNTYVVLDHNPGGAKAGFDYGRHFLFQAHEIFSSDVAYITRINLDITDKAHRITLLTPLGSDGQTHMTSLDGSCWNPFTQKLLFTQEAGSNGGVVEIGANFPSKLKFLYGIMGHGGFEGIHPDDKGNILIIEDVGGTSVSVDPSNPSAAVAAKDPNSFVYRFVPNNPANLSAGGKMQALQVSIDGKPVKFVAVDAAHPTGDVFSTNQLKLHTPGTSYPCRWITIHNTDTDGTASFDANALAKSKGATPFKRPENAAFQPGTGFQTFFFDPTGDTNADAGNQPALASRGSWGSIFRVNFPAGSANGTISIFVLGGPQHASFDNLTFLDSDTLLAAEDRGDTLHKQLNKLDSVWLFETTAKNPAGTRIIAVGRDSAALHDVNLTNAGISHQNEGDNEPTGVHVSAGETTVDGLLGQPFNSDSRFFWTQQHGQNHVFEIIPNQ
ncbi:MAG TPA: alkaline phosphatase PhoX, partial [Acidobacteriota bacterium]|nr:alkaline phosphatase PhoX [Acidobacteriota bacterium]